jgi:hypothetical protein
VPLDMCLVMTVQIFHQTKSGGPAISGINISYTRKLCMTIQFLFFSPFNIAYNFPLFSIQVFWPIVCRCENSCPQTTYVCYFPLFCLLVSDYASCVPYLHSHVTFYHLSQLCQKTFYCWDVLPKHTVCLYFQLQTYDFGFVSCDTVWLCRQVGGTCCHHPQGMND